MKKIKDDELTGYIGKSEKEARKIASNNSQTIRLTRVDEERYMVTMDFRMDRVNIELDNGIVTSANLG
jgi:hypothetical protein